MAEIDVQALYQKWNAAILKQIEEMKIRQWCVEQAVKIMVVEKDNDLVTLADEIYWFITAPLGHFFTRTNEANTSQSKPSTAQTEPSAQSADAWSSTE